MACASGLLGANISIGSRQPHIDNRLQCTASSIGLNEFDKKCLVSRGCQKEGQFIRVNYHIQVWDNDCWSNEVVAWSHQRQIDTGMGIICQGEQFLKTRYPAAANVRSSFRPGPKCYYGFR